MSAFESRCEELYGPSTLVRNLRPAGRARDRGYHTNSTDSNQSRPYSTSGPSQQRQHLDAQGADKAE